MVKSRKKAKPDHRKTPAQIKPDNPFEQLYQHKKFDVLGKRFKGDSRKLIKSRADAVDKRNKSLLVEYKQLRKANSFLDNRFGEDDASLTAEDKALARFQKERIKEERGSRFQLADEADTDALTHLGRSLGDAAHFQQGFSDIMDTAQEELPADFVDAYHFGGFVRKPDGSADQPEAGPAAERRTKKEVMEEVMAKSKAFKAAKQQQREEDLTQTEALDEDLAALLQAGGLAGMRKTKGEKARAIGPVAKEDAVYDRLRRELAFEPKGKADQPIKSAMQLQEEQNERHTALEKQRLKRSHEGGDDLDKDMYEDIAAPKGGFAARRHKQRKLDAAPTATAGPSGDALEDDFEAGLDDASGSGDDSSEGSDDSDSAQPQGKLTLQQRRQARAAGDHPLQASFRAAAAKLLQKHGIKSKKLIAGSSEEEAEEGDESDVESEEEQGSKESTESGETDNESSEAVEGNVDSAHRQMGNGQLAKAGTALHNTADKSGDSSHESPGEEESESEQSGLSSGGEEAESEAGQQEGAQPARDSGENASSSDESDSDLEAELRVAQEIDAESSQHASPGTALQKSLQGSGRSAVQAATHKAEHTKIIAGPPAAQEPSTVSHADVTANIPETHAAFADGVRGLSAKQLGDTISQIRSKHASSLAANKRHQLQVLHGIVLQHFATCAAEQPVPMDKVDVLMSQLLAMTPEVPYYAATAARARLSRSLDKLQASLQQHRQDADHNEEASSTGAWPNVRTLLLLRLWSILFPASDRKHPVLAPAAVLVGSYLSNCRITQPHHIATGLFLTQLSLDYAAPAKRYMPEPLTFASALIHSALPHPEDGDAQHIPPELLLRPLGGWETLKLSSQHKLELSHCQPRSSMSNALKHAALLAAVRVVQRSAGDSDDSAGIPEALAPAEQLLQKLLQERGLPAEVQAACKHALAAVTAKCTALLTRRKPLQRGVDGSRVAAVKLFNPRFEDDFVAGKNYDPDRERAESQKLKREVKKEQRGAMRELRKDAAFLHTAREAEANAAKAERTAKLRAGRSFMQQQAADMASGGQKGMWRKKKRK